MSVTDETVQGRRLRVYTLAEIARRRGTATGSVWKWASRHGLHQLRGVYDADAVDRALGEPEPSGSPDTQT